VTAGDSSYQLLLALLPHLHHKLYATPTGRRQGQAPLSSAVLTGLIISNKPLRQPHNLLSNSVTNYLHHAPSPLRTAALFLGEDQRPIPF